MNGPPPSTVAGSVHRYLLADEIATSLMTGRSVVLTHTDLVADVLALVTDTLVQAAVRVLSLRPSPDSTAFLAQFAKEWCVAGAGEERPGAMPPRGSDKRFVLVIDQAQAIPPGTFRQLDSMAQAWPGMQLLLAGSPGLTGLVHGGGQPLIPCRAWTTVAAPAVARMAETSLSDRSAWETRVPARRRPLRWVALGSLILAAAAVSVFVAVPNISLDMEETARSLGILPASTGSARLAAEPSADAATPPPLAAASRPASPEDIASAQLPQPDQAPPVRTAAAAPADPAGDHPGERTAPLAAASIAPAVNDLVASPALPPLPSPETSQEPAAMASLAPAPHSQYPVPAGREPPPAGPGMAPDMVEAMTRRGLAMLDFGDVSAARLLLARAAAAGSAAAAYAMGTTFDAKTLERLGAVGIAPDQAAAASWFQLALMLGDDRARAMLGERPTGAVRTGAQ